jgi:hypothetical protein
VSEYQEWSMTKIGVISAAVVLVVAACSVAPPQPKPPVWSANYVLPYDFMANCLANRPPAGYTASLPAFNGDGRAVISVVPVNAPPISAHYVVSRVSGYSTQVDWRRPDHIGGLDWLDNEARQKANSCAA